MTWPNSFANNDLFRPDVLDGIFLYKHSMNYKKEYVKFKEMRARASAYTSMVDDDALDGNNSKDENDDVDHDYGDGMEPINVDNASLPSPKSFNSLLNILVMNSPV